jgi:hypothetical protein
MLAVPTQNVPSADWWSARRSVAGPMPAKSSSFSAIEGAPSGPASRRHAPRLTVSNHTRPERSTIADGSQPHPDPICLLGARTSVRATPSAPTRVIPYVRATHSAPDPS